MKKFLLSILAGFVFLNVALILGAMVARRRLPRYGDEHSDTFALVAAMDGVDFASKADPLRSGSGTAVAGGIEIDLTGARPAGMATLDLTAVAGGIDVVVPQDWRVEMDSSAFMGGIDNLTEPDAAGEDAPVLVVTAKAFMGGIAVRAQETLSAAE